MPFEYDRAKSTANRRKHGIDFEDAQALWEDDDRLEAPLETHPEHRYLAIGQISGKCWTAVFTYRNESIRLISVRRARKKEIEAYENKND